MVNEMKKHGDVILKKLRRERQLSISDMERQLPLSRGQVRIAIAYLLGSEKIEEVPVGKARVYFLK